MPANARGWRREEIREGRYFYDGDKSDLDTRYTQVGKFDLRPAINNTAETRFNYS